MKKRKVIVTGGAGFIGSHLVDKLVKLRFKVIVVDNFSTGKIDNLDESKSKIKIIKQDISNCEELQKALKHEKSVDYIFHLAALPRIERSVDNPIETHKANVEGTFAVLELARFLDVKKLIFTSSSSVYGAQKRKVFSENLKPNPLNPYAAQKLIGEIYCDIYSKVYKIPVVSFRLFNVYGKRMDSQAGYKLVFTRWLEQTRNGEPLTIYGDGEQTRDFTHISDAVKAIVKAMNFNPQNKYKIINIGSGRQVSINYLAKLFKMPTVHVSPRKFEERFKQADIRKAKRLLSWIPKVSIEEGVSNLLKK